MSLDCCFVVVIWVFRLMKKVSFFLWELAITMVRFGSRHRVGLHWEDNAHRLVRKANESCRSLSRFSLRPFIALVSRDNENHIDWWFQQLPGPLATCSLKSSRIAPTVENRTQIPIYLAYNYSLSRNLGWNLVLAL